LAREYGGHGRTLEYGRNASRSRSGVEDITAWFCAADEGQQRLDSPLALIDDFDCEIALLKETDREAKD
jgi:hypothetical protein